MAYNKIWPVHGNVAGSIDYVENENKTKERIEIKSINDVILYAMQKEKVKENDEVHLKEYVTAINCNKDTAYQEMQLIKDHYGKCDKILAFHAIQSFKPGEITPEEAHQIGIELADRMWGDRYQVVVTTHLDRKHLHNHFVINSVSYLDGYKFYANKASLQKQRDISDEICISCGLSVIPEKDNQVGMSRGAYRAKMENRHTLAQIARDDIDYCISVAASMKEFEYLMKYNGYRINWYGKYAKVYPYGHRKAIRIDRREGSDYSYDGIQERIKEGIGKTKVLQKKSYKAHVKQLPRQRLSGYRALYVRYLYVLGKIPKQHYKPSHYLLREDLTRLNTLTAEVRFIANNHIENDVDLSAVKSEKQIILDALTEKRESLRNKYRRCGESEKADIRNEINSYNASIKGVRTELFYCNDIKIRSVEMNEKIKAVENRDKEGVILYGRSSGSGSYSKNEQRSRNAGI